MVQHFGKVLTEEEELGLNESPSSERLLGYKCKNESVVFVYLKISRRRRCGFSLDRNAKTLIASELNFLITHYLYLSIIVCKNYFSFLIQFI